MNGWSPQKTDDVDTVLMSSPNTKSPNEFNIAVWVKIKGDSTMEKRQINYSDGQWPNVFQRVSYILVFMNNSDEMRTVGYINL